MVQDHPEELGRAQVASEAKIALESIAATDAAFGERMQLEAAVDYWEQKRKSHSTNRANAFGHGRVSGGFCQPFV